MSVILNEIELVGPGEHGTIWHVTEVVGWDAIDVRTEVVTAPGAKGGFAGEWVEDSRALSIVGTITAPSEAALLDAINTLIAQSTILNTDVPLVVQRFGDSKILQVRLAGRQMVKILTGHVATYEIPLIALNPTPLVLGTPSP